MTFLKGFNSLVKRIIQKASKKRNARLLKRVFIPFLKGMIKRECETYKEGFDPTNKRIVLIRLLKRNAIILAP